MDLLYSEASYRSREGLQLFLGRVEEKYPPRKNKIKIRGSTPIPFSFKFDLYFFPTMGFHIVFPNTKPLETKDEVVCIM